MAGNRIVWEGSNNRYSLGDPNSLMVNSTEGFANATDSIGKHLGNIDKVHQDANAARLMQHMQQYQTADQYQAPDAQAALQAQLASYGNNIDRKAMQELVQKQNDTLIARDTNAHALNVSQQEFNENQASKVLLDAIVRGRPQAEVDALANDYAAKGINILGDTQRQVSADILAKGNANIRTNEYQQLLKHQTAKGLANLSLDPNNEQLVKEQIGNDYQLGALVQEYATGFRSGEAKLQGELLLNQGRQQDNTLGQNKVQVSNAAVGQYFGPGNVSPNYGKNVEKLNKARPTLSKYQTQITQYSQQYGVSDSLVAAVIATESEGSVGAKSPVGARGLMQLMPPTYSDLVKGTKYAGVHIDDLPPEANIELGTKYLGQLLKRYNGDTDKALAAYNAGMGNVDSWIKLATKNGTDWKQYIKTQETRDYLERVSDVLAGIHGGANQGGGQSAGGLVPTVDGDLVQPKGTEYDHTKDPMVMKDHYLYKVKSQVAKDFAPGTNYLPGDPYTVNDFKEESAKTGLFQRSVSATNSAGIKAVDLAIANKAIKNWSKIPDARKGYVLRDALAGYDPARLLNLLDPNVENYNEVLKRMQRATDAELLRQSAARNAKVDSYIQSTVADMTKQFGTTPQQNFQLLGLDEFGKPRKDVPSPFTP